MLLLRLFGFAVTGCVLITVAVLDTVDAAPASCSGAKEHDEAHRFKLAEEEYAAVLKDDSESRCAINGLQEIRCDRADAIRAKLPSEASQKYLAVLKDHPNASCADEGLKEVGKDRCAAAQELLDQGSVEEAVKAYTALLAVEPRPSCVPQGLREAERLREKGAEAKQPKPQIPQVKCCCGCRESHHKGGHGCNR